tara:strand:- start:248 stop:514 length:267 start_codon:yes stop_codon:yes gene_type:complete
LGVLTVAGGDIAVTSLSVGAVVSITKVLTVSALLGLLALSVTVILQLLWVPSGRALKVIVLLEAVAAVVELLQSPEYVMVPASFELKV